ncbi:MAG: hypothetical protein HY860_01595 [Chlamydiales bacterium]|nr:hypothetical protein [Chlamydiales bacterium]
MLNILRRYQRGIFLVTAVIVIITFSFFGANRIANNPGVEEHSTKKDLQIAKAVDGSGIYQSQVDKMMRFLSEESVVDQSRQSSFYPNIFNDDFVTKDIFDSKIALILGKHYFELFSEEIKIKQERFKQYKPYEHPLAPYISMTNVWERFAPQLFKDYQEFKQLSLEESYLAFEKMVDLYLHSKTISAPLMKQLLYYLEGQYSFLEKDSFLQSGDFALFHAHSLKDWFGNNFMEIVCQFVINGAKYAKENGYVVTLEEAKASLFKNAKDVLSHQQKEINDKEINTYFHNFLSVYGLTEKETLDIWQQVLLFRRLFHDNAAKIFVDPMLYEDYVSFASKEANITLYELPKEYRFEELKDLYLFETYMQSIAKKDKQDVAGIGSTCYSLSEIEENTPELIQKEFKLRVAELTKKELMLSVGVKELWDYAVQEDHWKHLTKDYPELMFIATKADRLKALQSLEIEPRNKIYQQAKSEIVNLHPEWAREALFTVTMKDEAIAVPYFGDHLFFHGFTSGKELITFLSQLKEESIFTKDNEHFYKIEVTEVGNDCVLSFKEAKENKVLEVLLDRHLKVAYDKYKETNSELQGLEFDQCKDKVGYIVYRGLIDQLKAYAYNMGITININEIDQVAKTRFLKFLNKKKQQLMHEDNVVQVPELMAQFELNKKDISLKRNAYQPLPDDQFFRMKKGEWSDVITLQDESFAFFKMNDIEFNHQELAQEVEKGRKLLGDESKRFIANQLMKEMQQKSSISLEKSKDLIADAP